MKYKKQILTLSAALVLSNPAGAAVYFFDFQDGANGGAQNATPAVGATGQAIGGVTSPVVNFAEGSLSFSSVNAWSDGGNAGLVGNDFWFVDGGNGTSPMTTTLALTTPGTTATIEFFLGRPGNTPTLTYTGLDAVGGSYSFTTVAAGGGSVDVSGTTPALGNGAVTTIFSAAADWRIGGVRITTIPEPSTGILLGLIGGIAVLRRSRR